MSLYDDTEPLLTPGEVATLFRVDPKTVSRWAKAGKLSCVRTLGGHRRYVESEVRELLELTDRGDRPHGRGVAG
jgi:excisionase family DNA binding protein